MTINAGGNWSEIPGLSALIGDELEALEFCETATMREVFAGGRNGVFVSRDLGSGFGPWLELGGLSLPNAKVRDLDYDSTSDTLVVGLQGRGAWVLKDVTTLPIPEPSTILLAAGALTLGLMRRRR